MDNFYRLSAPKMTRVLADTQNAPQPLVLNAERHRTKIHVIKPLAVRPSETNSRPHAAPNLAEESLSSVLTDLATAESSMT